MFKSEAQRRKLAEMVKQGKFPKEKYDQWHQATAEQKLPERVNPKKESFMPVQEALKAFQEGKK